MSLPNILIEELERAKVVVLQHPQHDLALGQRQTIWNLMGSKTDVPDRRNLGYRRRVNLAIQSTRHVLPIWEAIWSEDPTPQRILVEAEQVLNGTTDLEQAWVDRNQFWVYALDLSNTQEAYHTDSFVAFSAVQALTTALTDEIFDPCHIDKTLTDADIDPEELDASFCAAVAFSRGAVWTENSDASKRQQFWNWWLEDAVPSAWESVQLPSS
jgi:hypothetical protein